jgi:hypothetical protein
MTSGAARYRVNVSVIRLDDWDRVERRSYWWMVSNSINVSSIHIGKKIAKPLLFSLFLEWRTTQIRCVVLIEKNRPRVGERC